MAAHFPRHSKPKAPPSPRDDTPDRIPSNAELLADLTPYGDKRSRPSEIPRTSRRTRDFLLTAGIGSTVIIVGIAKVMGGSDPAAMVKLALTGMGLFCALLWYIFYGVMSRY